MQTIIIRADSSSRIGTGHVMRCLALAQAWKDIYGDAIFVMHQPDAAMDRRIRDAKCDVISLNASPGSSQDSEELSRIALANSAGWVVVDGYGFDAEYQRAIKAGGLKLLLVDDEAKSSHYFADLLLNQNVYAQEQLYPNREPHTKLLLGLQFAMLRREFSAWSDWHRGICAVGNKVLVTMGGSDPDNITLTVIQGLNLVKKQLEVAVVIGGSNSNADSIESAVDHYRGKIRLLKNASMPELMAWADLAVSSAGTTSAELCMMGLPAILVDIAPNQSPVAQELERAGAAYHMTVDAVRDGKQFAVKVDNILSSAEIRTSMSQVGRSLVDEKGAQRVASSILGLHLRPAEEKDCKLLWEWANDPLVRAASFRQESVPWEQHAKWFQAQLRDGQKSQIMIAVDSGQKEIGTVRFNFDGNRAVVSISLDKTARGKGNAAAILKTAVEDIFRSSRAVAIDAYVKPQNEPSKKLFERVGFNQSSSLETIHGEPAIHFVLGKDGTP